MINKITLRTCSQLSEAEILFRNLPQDNLANHTDKIVAKVKAGIAKIYEVYIDNRKVGFIATEVFGDEFVILALHSAEQIDAFFNLAPVIETLAKQSGCRCVTFSTVRAGLIAKGLSNNYQISEVVLKKYL